MTDRVSELKLFFSTPVWVSRVKNHQDVNKKILEYESADVYPDFYPKNSYMNRSKNTKLC